MDGGQGAYLSTRSNDANCGCYCCFCFWVKVEDGEIVEDPNGAKDVKEHDSATDGGTTVSNENCKHLLKPGQRG